MSKQISSRRRFRTFFAALLVGSAVVVATQSPASPVLAAAPSSMAITDLVRDSAAGRMSIYWSATGGAPTSIQVDMCNDSVTFNTPTNPVVVNYSSLCTQYPGGIAGWITDPNTSPWSSEWLYVYAINNDGNSRDYMMFRPTGLSRAMISGSPTSYANGCVATATVSGLPAWANTSDASWGMTFWEDETGGQGSAVPAGLIGVSNGVATVKGFFNLGQWGASPPTGYTDGVSVQLSVYNTVTQVAVESLKSSNFMCTLDANLPVVRGAAPVAQVSATNGGFTIDWTLTSSGSHPVSKVYVTLFSDNATLNQTQTAPTTADIEAYCANPVDFNDPNSGTYFNPYCQTPVAWTSVVDAPFAMAGRIVSSSLQNSQDYSYLQLVNGRAYWVAITVENYAPYGSSMSASSQLFQITPSAAPTVTAVSPASGSTAGGTAITITGTGFAAGSTVTVGGQACTNVNRVSSTSITCTTPAGSAGTASVVVTSGGQSNAANTLFSYVAPTTTTTAPTTTAPAATPTLVNSSNQSQLTRQPGSATALVNGQPVTPVVETPADLPAAQVDPEDRSPAQVQSLQTAADDLVSQLNQSAGGNSGLAVVDTPAGANLTGLLTVPVPIENTVLVEAGSKSTLFAALNQDGSVTEVQPGAVIEVLGNGQVGVLASGLTPGETVEFVIMSTPTLLGTYTVAANGTIKSQAALPTGIGLGNHTLVVASPTVQASLGLKVTAGALPATGVDSSRGPISVALWLLAGGAFVAVIRRRRFIVD